MESPAPFRTIVPASLAVLSPVQSRFLWESRAERFALVLGGLSLPMIVGVVREAHHTNNHRFIAAMQY